jgi:hypothetical protein
MQLLGNIVALLSASLAWLAFRTTRYDRRVAEYDSVQRALNALRYDLKVISEWAPPYERKSLEEYRILKNGDYYNDWCRPHRIIFRFNYDAVRAVRQNPPVPNFDEQLLSDLATLDHAITNFFSVLDRYERMVQSDPKLLRQFYLKMEAEKAGEKVKYSKDEKELQELAYRLNHGIHVGAIGSEEPEDRDSPGLHWAYEQARQSVDRIARKWSKRPGVFTYEHPSYFIGDFSALTFFGLALLFVAFIVPDFSRELTRFLWWLLLTCEGT